ncbi:MAG TPA: L,D-transpeptidase family protein [Sphingorhabdus sp.]|jgi:lipoprotein-anchoring transpeptidase ErfK/SrfK|nr:L,D-transpeptidase family protein [Sphingorhabdus sp.]
MTFRTSIRMLQVTVLLGLSAPLVAQAGPVFQPGTGTVSSPVLPAEPEGDAATPAVEAPVVAPAPKPKVATRKGPVDGLKPGQFVWEKHDAYVGPLKIVAVLDIQRLYVFQNDKLIGFSTISAGKKGKETPTGYFNILQKNIDHKSNLYSNAPMPFMQRLTWDGIAIHGGHIPGYPASHGCIRLPHAFAKALFDVTQMEQEVVVLQNFATPVKRPEPKPVPVIDPPVVAPVTPEVTPPASPPKPAA